jgi:flagellar assembly protein FliH
MPLHPPPRQVPEPDRRGGERRVSYARFIPREEMPEEIEAWSPEALNGPPIARPPIFAPPPPEPKPEAAKSNAASAGAADEQAPPPANIEELTKGARQSGYQDGYRDGLAALDAFKQSFSRQISGQIGTLVTSFDADLRALEDQMAESLLRCAVELARQVVRNELQTHPDLIARVAHDAVEALQLSAKHVRVRVHPDDFPLVKAGAGDEMRARNAQILPDESILRGGCTVESDIGTVDATLPTRWQHAAATLGQISVWEDRRSARAQTPPPGPTPAPPPLEASSAPEGEA